jgi:hypothetical protein
MSTRLHIVMYVPGLPVNAKTLTTESLGGSETAGLSMARALEKRGHKIYLFCNTDKQESVGQIEYIPMDMFMQFVTYIHHDVCIVQRVPVDVSIPQSGEVDRSMVARHVPGALSRQVRFRVVEHGQNNAFVRLHGRSTTRTFTAINWSRMTLSGRPGTGLISTCFRNSIRLKSGIAKC